MKESSRTSKLICINPASPCHEGAQESQTQSNIWPLLRVMDSLPQVVVGGGSYGLYGAWKFKRVNTCGYNTTLARVESWERGENGRFSGKSAFIPR